MTLSTRFSPLSFMNVSATFAAVEPGFWSKIQVSKGGWLYIDDDADRFCPDRDKVIELYQATEDLARKKLEKA